MIYTNPCSYIYDPSSDGSYMPSFSGLLGYHNQKLSTVKAVLSNLSGTSRLLDIILQILECYT